MLFFINCLTQELKTSLSFIITHELESLKVSNFVLIFVSSKENFGAELTNYVSIL